jgi:flagellar biosynthetic protein FliQ
MSKECRMQEGDVGSVLREAMVVMVKLSGPPLLMMLTVGLVMSLVQAVTQINEQSLAFVPKVIVIGGTLLLLGPFMMATLRDYMHLVMDRVVAVGGM